MRGLGVGWGLKGAPSQLLSRGGGPLVLQRSQDCREPNAMCFLKDRQQVITAVLPQSQLNGLWDFVLNQHYFYHMS